MNLLYNGLIPVQTGLVQLSGAPMSLCAYVHMRIYIYLSQMLLCSEDVGLRYCVLHIYSCMFVCVHIYIYTYVYVFIAIYIICENWISVRPHLQWHEDTNSFHNCENKIGPPHLCSRPHQTALVFLKQTWTLVCNISQYFLYRNVFWILCG